MPLQSPYKPVGSAAAAAADRMQVTELKENEVTGGQLPFKASKVYWFDLPINFRYAINICVMTITVETFNGTQVSVEARHGAKPTPFSSNLKATQVNGRWVLTVNSYSPIPILPGVWYISVTGQSFLESAHFSIHLQVKV